MAFIKVFLCLLLISILPDCTKVTVDNISTPKKQVQPLVIPKIAPEIREIITNGKQEPDNHSHMGNWVNIPEIEKQENAAGKGDNLKTVTTTTTSGSNTAGGSSSGPRNNNPGPGTKPSEIIIENVVLTETGKSIMEVGATAEAAIEPDFAGKEIFLTITGKFNTTPIMKLANMDFTNETGLIHLSVVEEEVLIKVLLDDVILFTPVSASPTEIKVKLDSKGIPDLYLKGLHKLTIQDEEYFSETLIKIGDPAPVLSLAPAISSVEILKDSNNKPVNLKLTGKNFMLYYRYSYSQIDGKFGFGHQTSVTEMDGTLGWEAIVHIPDIPDFESKTEHTISYATPFGVAFKTFGD